MSGGLLGIVTLMYMGVAADQFAKGNPWMGLVWAGYALANIGMLGVVK